MSESKDENECYLENKQLNSISLTITEESKEEKKNTNCDTEFEKLQVRSKADLFNEIDSEASEDCGSKSILSNGNLTVSKRNSKKVVTFDPGDEDVKKFTEGEVIVDKKNPFKNGNIPDVSVDNNIVYKLRKNGKLNDTNETEFVTTEEVLRESKFVTTYIKNPDKCFKYDPSVIARMKFDELKDIKGKKPVRKVTLTRQTQERLKELKSKYSPAPLYAQSKLTKPKQSTVVPPVESRIPKYKKVSKSNYPELSQIKIKTGTDLDESFRFNPDEVAVNVKRFDDRLKTLRISSDDELDDIDEPLSCTEDSYLFDEVDAAPKEETKKSFTNTVNSNEFKEFLIKKGLALTPKSKASPTSVKPIETNELLQPSTIADSNMDFKKEKKASVFHRLLHPSIFSSKRKTTPRDSVPIPQNVYSNSIESSRPPSNMKRVVLERQSFHGGSMNGSLNSSNDLRKQIEQSRKSYGGDDRSSSISSALTNAEDFADDHSTDSILELGNSFSDVRSSAKSRNPGRIPVRNKDMQPRSIQSKSVSDIRDTTVKPRIATKPVPAIRRSLERQSLIQRRPPAIVTGDNPTFGRSVSMDRQEITRRTQNSAKTNLIPKQVRNGMIPSKSASMPRSSKEQYDPRSTSTPIQNKVLTKHTSLNAERPTGVTSSNLNVSSAEWNKLREMKERTDMQLYMRSIAAQDPKLSATGVQLAENIYEKLPIEHPRTRLSYAPVVQQIYSSNVALNPNFTRGTPQRNTYNGGYGNKTIKMIDEDTIEVRPQHAMPIDRTTVQVQQPRSQSVLEDMMVPHQSVYGSVAGTPVIMRRKPAAALTKEEILNRVRDFCRKSMNKTPTKLEQPNEQLQSDISPVSYASVNYPRRNVQQIVAPQVPQRVHSLQYSQAPQFTPSTSPVYAHVMKRGSLQSNGSDVFFSPSRKTASLSRQRLPTNSDTDSVFLPSIRQSASPERILVLDRNKVAPANLMQFRDQSGNEVYVPSSYAQLSPRSQILSNSRVRLDGMSTPLILMESRPNASPTYWNTAPQQDRPHPPQPQLQTKQDNVYLRLPGYGAVGVHRANNPSLQYSPRLLPYESESGSEAGEVQRIMQNRVFEEDWQNDKSGRNQSSDQAPDDRRRGNRREDPRRHTLGSDMLQYGSQGQAPQRAMDLEAPPIRGYTPINQGPLFDDDPGIMSEVETASTGFRRGGKQRSSLPVVRTPSKTLERPLGLVFLQYRSETKRALLPNEITSIDTVRALFVRSFPRQLTMAYLEGPNVKIYIHDASKDMFYELEDVRSHLREIRDRSVLRLFESNEVAAPQVLPGGSGVPQPLPQSSGGHWDQDQSYFSEPEFDSEYQHQHIHKSKGSKPAPYYVGGTQTLPRGMYSDRNKNSVDGYTSSPERGTRGGYEEPYYSQYGTRGNTVTPIIDEEQRCDGNLTDDQYSLYGMKVTGRIPRSANQLYDPTRPEDLHRIRVEHMERQLANLTGLVQKALNQNPQIAPPSGSISSNYLGVPSQCRGGLDDMDGHSSGSSTSIQDKSVSFEKSVSFSDDIQGVPKSHSPQHAADTKPPKPAIKSSTLPRTSSQERDRLKPPPPPKPLALASTHPNYRPDIALAPEVYNHLRGLQKRAKDLRMEVRTLRRLSQAQSVAVREDIKDAFMRIRATLLASSGSYWGQGDQEKTRMSREEELYKQEVIRLEKDLSDLESSVEGLRGEVINRRTRVNMAAVEDMALVLSRASKTVAELKMRFPGLQQGVRNILANEMEKVVREEKFLKDEPDRLESALRRCKKLTGTLVTLKRLASVQEQRLPVVEPINEDPPRSGEISSANKPIPSPRLGTVTLGGGIAPENALDALLDELQTFAKPQSQQGDVRLDDSTSDDSSQALHNTITTQLSQSSLFPNNDPNTLQVNTNIGNNLPNNGFIPSNIGSLRRLHSYPSGSDTDTSPPQPPRPVGKPPVPERNADLLTKVGNKRIPPPPPPRTSSRSPLASPTSPNVPQRLSSVCESDQLGNGSGSGQDGSGNSSGNESGNDQTQRQLALEMRHQELLKKQKQLQEQYARLQQISKNSVALPPADILQLKKTGSESNLPQKMGLSMTVTGSMKNLNVDINVAEKNEKNLNISSATNDNDNIISNTTGTTSTTNKVYETDIL